MAQEGAPPPAAGSGDLAGLLQPTLTAAPVRPLYSVRAGFFVAFFGGVFAAVFFSALNSQRLGRLRRDLWLYALAALVWAAGLVAAGYWVAAGTHPQWLEAAGSPARTVRLGGRLLALACFGLFYLRHRAAYKGQALFGEDPPSPWKAALSAVAAALLLSLLLGLLGALLAHA